MSNMNELRYLVDVAKDPALASARKKFKKGVKKLNGVLKKKLVRGTRKTSEFIIKTAWQRDISGNQIIKYEQFDPQLATVCVVSVRPEHLGGQVILVDGQHTSMMDIIGECDQELDTLELHHSPTATLDEINEIEGRLYKALNTQNKKLSKLDIIRVDIFLNETYAIRFENILKLCNLNVDGIGAPTGDIISGTGARIIKTIEQYGEDHSQYIVQAVNFMRDTWGSENNPLLDIRDDMIHGLTTLFAFIDNVGNIDGGSPQGLCDKKAKLKLWMQTKMREISMRKFHHNTGGGNTHFKIVHNIIEEYNYWKHSKKISKQYLHDNGILDSNVILTKKQRKALPSFPSDINIFEEKSANLSVIDIGGTKKWEQTISIINDNFDIGEEFTYPQVRDHIYPVRSKEFSFKSEESFKGTILRELQDLEKKGLIYLHANEGRSGRYSRLR